MLEKKEEVAEIVKAAMSELALDKKGHIEFYALIPDSVGFKESDHAPAVWQDAPRWVVKFNYPVDDEASRTSSFQINTSDFDNLDQIRSFIITEIGL